MRERLGCAVGVLAFVVVCLLTAAACGDETTSPSGVLTGAWSGTVVDSVSGSGAARLVLEQRAASISGTFTTTFGGVVSREGAVSGSANGPIATLFFMPPTLLVCGPGVTLSGTLAITLTLSGSRLAGTYSGFTCGGALSGTLDLTEG